MLLRDETHLHSPQQQNQEYGSFEISIPNTKTNIFFPPSLLFRLIPLAIKPIKKLRNFTAPRQEWLAMGNPEEKKNETAHVEY